MEKADRAHRSSGYQPSAMPVPDCVIMRMISTMRPLHLTCVAGARPNFMKMAALLDAAAARPAIRIRLVHTGQHYSPEMSGQLFADLEMPEPAVNLGLGGGTQTRQTAEIMIALEAEFTTHRPDCVVVVGDVNSTMAAALVAAKLGVPIAHVEAGLRSFDRSMPEEINRLVTDTLSDFLFASEPSGVENLRREGVPESKIFFCGNVMIDTLLRFQPKARARPILSQLGLGKNQYAVVTLHRPSNVDDPARLLPLMRMLEEVAAELPVVLPVHPRTRQKLEGYTPPPGLRLLNPLGYLDFLCLTMHARLVITDSGGIQEETTVLGVPCLTLRDNTERPCTIEVGANRLAGSNPEVALAAIREVLAGGPRSWRVPGLWDGRAAGRILDVLQQKLQPADQDS